ncbi:ribosome hibernation-promoting factor, HPF/YfiA family [Agromyces aerolatus]|uniref:ribosome hibernation-promoting factor, HPF/YfiA family n=1 Tax=Agromyces sp. LY-1074 TaxID=3074080 RepID=UPI002864342C|nr:MULTISPECIES: ribosome-associated translation inhibitor RaiA [unclassified Agromyces]MDR5699835.1 ribosome-associated translation inhibitor RaiA [Agromyces sp. LY-1074]MDR5706353.1 ribosome-associated translation inhibitor RaiA [Agromyces sp. LY-1358]
MELNIVGRSLGITDRFRAYIEEKAEKVTHLAERAISLDVRLTRNSEKNGNPGPDRVELTLIGRGPVVRAEAEGSDKYAAFDVALGRLLERIRRAKDRRKVHRGGQRRPTSLREAADDGFAGVGVQAAGADVLEAVRTGSIPVVAEHPEGGSDEDEAYSPVVIRRKVFAATPMSVDDALYYMELVGHDFYLFVDEESGRPSVVYRRKGWDYGLIGLDDDAGSEQTDGLRERQTVAV